MTLFSAPNYCGEFDNAGGMMSVDETLMCSFQVKIFASFSWPRPVITFFPDLEAEREEGKISIPGSQQAPDTARSPGRSSSWNEEKMKTVTSGLTGLAAQSCYQIQILYTTVKVKVK